MHIRGPIAEVHDANADVNIGNSEAPKSYGDCQSEKHARHSIMNFAMLLQYVDYVTPLAPSLSSH